MVKFLSGGQYDGERVPVCTYWREDLATNASEDYAQLVGVTGGAGGQCIANAYFARSDITCFNSGECNGEGKCLPCSKYKYDGMRMAISHSPPVDILRSFDKALTENEMRSPNLARFPPGAINLVEQNQVPYHILTRNIQAQIAKCCHWNASDGTPSEFYLATILEGSVTAQITDVNGNPAYIKGIAVTNDEFPDSVGTFFPVGSVVVAGFKDQPSFYLEPKTGLMKSGEGVIFGSGGANSPTTKAKNLAVQATPLIVESVRAANFAASTAEQAYNQALDFFNLANATNDPATIAAAQAKLDTAEDKATAAIAAATEAQTLGNEANVLVGEVVNATDTDTILEKSQDLADKLNELADAVEDAGNNAGGGGSSQTAAAQAGFLRTLARELGFVGFGGFSKCEFFFSDDNVAEQWNFPEDGSLPCNGVRTDCFYYTGEEWLLATDEKMEPGQPVTGDQLQEVRFRSDDWERYSDPEDEFENRFSTPFIWAFKGYTDISGEPRIEDMLLYRPKVLFGRETSNAEYEAMLLEKIRITDFTNFDLTKTEWQAVPGSYTFNTRQVPDYPTVIAGPNVPSNIRLDITHPRQDEPFIYRTWSPEKNLITLFGTGTPDATIYIVNETALRNRGRYHAFLETQDYGDIPSGLPGAPDFNGVFSFELLEIFNELENEQLLNPSNAPLGFHKTTIGRDGFWQSVQTVDLVHNKTNTIYVFLLIDNFTFIFNSVEVDYRFLHAIMKQTRFSATDFTMNDSIGSTQTGANTTNTVNGAIIEAEADRIVGSEDVSLDQMYFGWRFKFRNLLNTNLEQSPDLIGASSVADTDLVADLVVTESDASAFITRVGYNVVQYRKQIDVTDWYLIGECGTIMLVLEDENLHRVLPLPDQTGNQIELTGVLVNGGGTGSVVAQWALEKVTLNFKGEEKDLGQVYRNVDGLGLPANYVVVGPKPGSDEQNAFGRPEPDRDTIQIDVTFLRAQTAGFAFNDPQQSEPELSEEVVKDNFNEDSFVFTTNDSTIGGNTFVAGLEGRSDEIQADQQDYVFVFKDSDGRPIGRKVTRFMVMYYNLSAIPIEIGYQWRGSCTTYGLSPDLFLTVGSNDGSTSVAPKGIVDPDTSAEEGGLLLGFRVAGLLGTRDCVSDPSCGDHEFINFGPLRQEFEVIVTSNEFPRGKAHFPNAGETVPGGLSTRTLRPGTQFLRKNGPLWYPYDTCEAPRYNFKTGGPLHTDSTELINRQTSPAGLGGIGQTVLTDAQAEASGGEFGGLADPVVEAYRGPDMVVPKILDIHPSLRPCTSAYTYGNQVLEGGSAGAKFSGYARERAEVDLFWYSGHAGFWEPPPLGNFGRNKSVVEIAEKRGDYLGGVRGDQVGLRWMPMFPEREDLGATIELFSEEMEPQHYRLICKSSPAGGISEGAPTRSSSKYTHKALIFNRALAAIEYPFAPYYPSFLPDASLGLEPGEGGRESDFPEGADGGDLTTMWAWREQEKGIRRGVDVGLDIIEGIDLQPPEYVIDSRRLEIRLRPEEGNHTIAYTPPQYDEEGQLTRNAFFELDDGPPRYIKVDFITRDMSFVLSADPNETGDVDSFYNTGQEIGEGVFECTEGTATDNLSLASKCTCEVDTKAEELDAQNLPARFLHLDELAPANYLALYENEEIQIPFAIDIPRGARDEPCCMCIYYVRGIFFSINNEFLPVNGSVNLTHDARFTFNHSFKYTWSRVPHGFPGGTADDGTFGGVEQQADQYLNFDAGQVFENQFVQGSTSLNVEAGTAAFFPSAQYALDNTISVNDPLDPGDPKLKGGAPANNDGESQGEPETITLDMAFDTYVRMKQITIKFVAGVGFEVPPVILGVVDQAQRTGDLVTRRAARIIAESTLITQGADIPNASSFRSADIQDGRVLYTVNIFPSYSSVPFWSQFGQEFHLIFGARSGDYSLGIASIDVVADAFIRDETIRERIFINERKYYISEGSPGGGKNPESFLGEADSATAYWRTAEVAATTGGNRNRAYGFGKKLTEDGKLQRGAPQNLELLQEEEYNKARDLLDYPYSWVFNGFIPLDEAEALEFYGGEQPEWTLNMGLEVSKIDEISKHDSEELLYGAVPKRNPWNAPGHAWTYNLDDEEYLYCCFPCPKSQVINYNYAHLHDNLAIVQTARFWDELPSGFTRLIRSTMMSPDPTFGQATEAGVGLDGGSTTGPVLLDEGLFRDSQGNPIDASTLSNAGLRRDPVTGGLVILETGGE